MKTLKFRFYDKTDKRMKYFDSIWNMQDPSYDSDDIQQFTGLLDKNGVEIYEGDILELKAQGSGYAVLNWVAVVEFGNPNGEYNWGWQLKPIKGVGINPDILLWVETEMPNVSCEVIGNIYENPELLESE
jgi:uncharacterized phage protein (TIGR01671 family)